jgi:hypothetical protein
VGENVAGHHTRCSSAAAVVDAGDGPTRSIVHQMQTDIEEKGLNHDGNAKILKR